MHVGGFRDLIGWHKKQNSTESEEDSVTRDSNRNSRREFLEKIVDSDRPRRLAVALAAFKENRTKKSQPH